MSVGEVVAAAVIAGILMAVAAEVGRFLRTSRSSLILTDGEFALRMISRGGPWPLAYVGGACIHLATSAVFGVVYFAIVRGLDINPYSAQVVAPYVFALWLAMLLTALPAAGKGFLGRSDGRFVWAEQLAFHAIFGVSFWWALQAV